MTSIALPTLTRQWIGRLALRAHAPSTAAVSSSWRGRRLALAKLDAIGDFVLATSILAPLHDDPAFGDVTLFCRGAVQRLARSQFPRWNAIALPPADRPLRSIWRDRGWRTRLWKLQPFDLLVDLRSRRDMADSIVASWIPAEHKVAMRNQTEIPGVMLECEHQIYDVLVDAPHPRPGIPLDLLNHGALARSQFPELEIEPLRPRLQLAPGAADAMRRRLELEHQVDPRLPLLVVAPGSLLALKEYPPGLLGSALQPILERREIEVLITGAASDQRATSALMQRLEAFPRVHDGTGRFSLEEHVEVVGVARTVLSMDSSTAHVAGALGIPAVVLLGGGQPGVFGPWGESPHFQWVTHPLPCFGCQWRCPFETARCLHRIPPAVVTSALESVLDSAA